MNETVYVYIVHSDINENNIYAEFRTETEALEYAKEHEDELTYVDKVEVVLDEDGEISEMFDSETIWVYGEEDEDPVEEDDDYWNQLAEEEEERKEDEALLGDTSWFEGLDTDSLVETLEENEDIVECKECFELFPKEACTKVAIGYICPECGKIHSHEEPEFEIDSIPDVLIADEDTFKVDFPELERAEYENDMMPDVPTPEVEPNPEPMAEPCVGPECEAPVEAPVTKEETITKLVVDEHEAIDGYEKAKIEIEANSELDDKEKEEILDTIEHIKEEEVEHIEELEELVDEVEETKEAEEAPAEEPESEDESEVLVEGPLGRKLVGIGRTIAGSNPDSFWDTDPKNASKPLAPHEGYYIKEVIPNANGKLETTGVVKEAKKFTEAETIAKAESKLTNKHYLITPKGEDKKEYVYKLALYKDGKLVEKSKDWRKAAVESKKASKLEATPKEDERVEVEEPKPNETPKDTTPKYTAAALNVTVGKATYVVVKDAELNASVNIKDCTVTADKEGIVEVSQNPKNKRWVVKGVKPGKVTLTIKKADKEICKCEVAVTAGKLSKEDQEALDRLRSLGYELTAPVAESLEEHVNEEHSAVESEQVLVGTDNAVVDCEVADVITHSEDEKPVDCEGKKKPLEKPLTEDLSEDKLQVMEDYLKSTKFASLDTEWEDEGDFYVDIIGAYLDYNTRTNMFSLGLSIYHASEDNNANNPESHTDEEEFNYDSLAEMYEDEECKEILDRIYLDNLAKLDTSLSEDTHAKYAKPEGNRVQAFNNALKYAKKENKPFIYGYTNHTGKFFAAETPMKVTGSPAEAEKEFRQQYKNCKIVYVVYPDKEFIESLTEEVDLDVHTVIARVDHWLENKDRPLYIYKSSNLKDTSTLDRIVDFLESKGIDYQVVKAEDGYVESNGKVIIYDSNDSNYPISELRDDPAIVLHPMYKYGPKDTSVYDFTNKTDCYYFDHVVSKLFKRYGKIDSEGLRQEYKAYKHISNSKLGRTFADCKSLEEVENKLDPYFDCVLSLPSKNREVERYDQIVSDLPKAIWEVVTGTKVDDEGLTEEMYIDSNFDEWVRCDWCGEIFLKEKCKYEVDFGWLCDRCQVSLRDHGGKLTFTDEIPEEDPIEIENIEEIE